MLTTVFSLPEEDKNVLKIMAFYQFESKISGLQLWCRKERLIFFVITKTHTSSQKQKPQTTQNKQTNQPKNTEKKKICNYIFVYAFTTFPTAKGINSQQQLRTTS